MHAAVRFSPCEIHRERQRERKILERKMKWFPSLEIHGWYGAVDQAGLIGELVYALSHFSREGLGVR